MATEAAELLFERVSGGRTEPRRNVHPFILRRRASCGTAERTRRNSISILPPEAEMTFARLTRDGGRYGVHVLRGRFVRFDGATNERLMRASTCSWPHAFARLDASSDEVLACYGSNHIHAVPGNVVAELRHVCAFLDIDLEGMGEI